jgi:hypothetical protein
MNNPTYTDRQVALQAAVEYSKTSGNINSSFDVVAVAERFRKFLEEGIVEQKAKPVQTQGTYTGGHKPKVGSLCF